MGSMGDQKSTALSCCCQAMLEQNELAVDKGLSSIVTHCTSSSLSLIPMSKQTVHDFAGDEL